MKRTFFILVMLALSPCDVFSPEFWNEKTHYIRFNTYAEQSNTYKEIRYYAIERNDNRVTRTDSVFFNAVNKNGTNETFPAGEGYGVAIHADSVLLIQNGFFEAVAVRKDLSLIKKDFGKIIAGKTHENYKITLRQNDILVEEL